MSNPKVIQRRLTSKKKLKENVLPRPKWGELATFTLTREKPKQHPNIQKQKHHSTKTITSFDKIKFEH